MHLQQNEWMRHAPKNIHENNWLGTLFQQNKKSAQNQNLCIEKRRSMNNATKANSFYYAFTQPKTIGHKVFRFLQTSNIKRRKIL